MEETKVRRSGPGVVPAVGMVVTCPGISCERRRVLAEEAAPGSWLMRNEDGRGEAGFLSMRMWKDGEYAILYTPSPDPGEAPPCRRMFRGSDGKDYRCQLEAGHDCPHLFPPHSQPADPRDVAIARWPWMAPFREVKVGDRYLDTGIASRVLTVTSIDWSSAKVVFQGSPCGTWAMDYKQGWPDLTPYREAKPVEATTLCAWQWCDDDGVDHQCDLKWKHDGPCSFEARIQKPSPWSCSNGKECRTPTAGPFNGRNIIIGLQPGGMCVACADKVVASMTEMHERVAHGPKPRPQPGYTMPGEHAQLALKGGWRRGWR